MRRAYFPIDVIHTFYGLLGRLADDGSPRRCATRHDDHKTKRHVIAGVTFQSGVIKCPHLSSPSNTLRIFLSFFCCWYLLNISMGLEIDGAKRIYKSWRHPFYGRRYGSAVNDMRVTDNMLHHSILYSNRFLLTSLGFKEEKDKYNHVIYGDNNSLG